MASSGLRLKSSSLCVLLHGTTSTDDSARELFKSTKDWQVSVCSEKKFLVSGFFVSDVISSVVLDLFGPLHLP